MINHFKTKPLLQTTGLKQMFLLNLSALKVPSINKQQGAKPSTLHSNKTECKRKHISLHFYLKNISIKLQQLSCLWISFCSTSVREVLSFLCLANRKTEAKQLGRLQREHEAELRKKPESSKAYMPSLESWENNREQLHV